VTHALSLNDDGDWLAVQTAANYFEGVKGWMD